MVLLVAVVFGCLPRASAVAETRFASDCAIGRAGQLTEGPTLKSRTVRSIGTRKAVMLFVDFPDAPASEDPSAIFSALVPPAQAFYQSVSYGRFRLAVTPVLGWLRMPAPSASYGFGDGVSADEQLKYMRDVVRVADPTVDFKGVDLVYVISSRGAALPNSPAFVAGPSSTIRADGTRIGFGATFGADIRAAPDGSYLYGQWILEHETAHTLGLPDLYRLGAPVGATHPDVGVWDTMGNIYRGTALMAWHRQKLGWLKSTQTTCVRHGSKRVLLTPMDRPGGRKLLAVRVDSKRVITAEVRRPLGTDAGLCGAGVLVSLIDASKPTGKSPVVVQRAAIAPPSPDYDCGATASAAYQPDQTFTSGRVSITVTRAVGDGFVVSATR